MSWSRSSIAAEPRSSTSSHVRGQSVLLLSCGHRLTTAAHWFSSFDDTRMGKGSIGNESDSASRLGLGRGEARTLAPFLDCTVRISSRMRCPTSPWPPRPTAAIASSASSRSSGLADANPARTSVHRSC